MPIAEYSGAWAVEAVDLQETDGVTRFTNKLGHVTSLAVAT
jgi:hypothetical protein